MIQPGLGTASGRLWGAVWIPRGGRWWSQVGEQRRVVGCNDGGGDSVGEGLDWKESGLRPRGAVDGGGSEGREKQR